MNCSQDSFQIDDRVLVNHLGTIYEARVVFEQSDTIQVIDVIQTSQEGSPLYRVHYLGWAKKWDETLSADCIVKKASTEDTREPQDSNSLKISKSIKKKTTMNYLQSFFVVGCFVYFPLKPKRSIPQIAVVLPTELQKVLVQDWIVGFP